MKFVPLRELAHTTSGGTPTRGNKTYYGGNIPWLKSGELPDGEILSAEESVTPLGLESSSAKLLPAGTLLIAMYGATVGKLGILTFPAATNQAVCAITPSEELDRDYLFHWLLSVRSQLVETSFGGAQPNISQAVIRDLEVPWVPVTEQHRIAARLKAQLAEVETARQAAQVQWTELQSLKSKALESAFDRVTDYRPIGSVAKLQSGYAFKSETFKPSGVRLLRNANILPGKIYWDDTVHLGEEDAKKYSSYELVAGDVLISLDRPIISSGIKVARVGDADLPALLLQRVGRFLLDQRQIDADYLYAYLQTSRFIDEISGHDQSLGVPHISPGQVEAVEIPLPDLPTQKTLAKRLVEISDALSVAAAGLQQQETDLAVLPQRLLAQAFEH